MSFLRPDLDDIRPYTRPPQPEGLTRLHMNEAAADCPASAPAPLLVKRHGGKLRPVRVGDSFPLEPWSAALEEDPRQLWLTLPNNPSGAWIPPEKLEPLLEAAARKSVLVVLDEAYAEFAPCTHR